jgi:hypothetical protein
MPRRSIRVRDPAAIGVVEISLAIDDDTIGGLGTRISPVTYFHRPYHLDEINDIVDEREHVIGAPKIDKHHGVVSSFIPVLLLRTESLSVTDG